MIHIIRNFIGFLWKSYNVEFFLQYQYITYFLLRLVRKALFYIHGAYELWQQKQSLIVLYKMNNVSCRTKIKITYLVMGNDEIRIKNKDIFCVCYIQRIAFHRNTCI